LAYKCLYTSSKGGYVTIRGSLSIGGDLGIFSPDVRPNKRIMDGTVNQLDNMKDVDDIGLSVKEYCYIVNTPSFKEVLTKTPLQIHNSLEVVKGIGDRSNVTIWKKPVKKTRKKKETGAIEGGLAPHIPISDTSLVEPPQSPRALRAQKPPRGFLMILMSYNLCGVGGAPKLLNLKRLLQSVNPDIIFLQETMVDNVKEKYFFMKCYPNWDCVEIDSNGLSGGLISGWNPMKEDLQAFQICAGIMLEGRLKDLSNKTLECIWTLQRYDFFLAALGR
jgi:hypothetical protein